MNQHVSATHTPVLLEEAMKALAVQPGGRYIDCTLGNGGHAAAILKQSSPGGQLLGIDADPSAIENARQRLAEWAGATQLVNDNFVNLQSICLKYDFQPVHGILLDLGLSSMQLDTEGRGFSFRNDAPLDMRFDPQQTITAADIVNRYGETELADIIRNYGEEINSQRIARCIIDARPLKSTRQLAQVVERALGSRKNSKIHPATRTFQALRIAVNHELENLEATLKQAVSLLGFGGRLVVISYHSLEDRIVKQFLHRESRDCICPPTTPECICQHTASLQLVNKKVIKPSAEEIARNPRSRSARLRAAERVFVNDDYRDASEGLCFAIGKNENGWRRPLLLERLRTTFWAS